ncbi:MAG: MarR family winged helix-turn-helix transcriptional regulator [Thermodesulfobacteriota bacterium]
MNKRIKEKNLLEDLDPKALAECRECTCFNLRKATRVVTQFYDDNMRPTGLRGTQFALLAHTQAMGPVALSKLAEVMVTDRTTLARNLEPLEKSGLVEVEDGDDRRVRIINITEEGRKKLSEAYPYWQRTQEEIKKMMGQYEWTALTSRLSVLVDRVQKK